MFLLYGPDLPEPGTPEAAKVMADWTVARQAMADAGVLIDCAPLQPPEASTTVRVRAVAVAMSEGPAAGLVILDALGGNQRITGWPQFHIARAELLTRV